MDGILINTHYIDYGRCHNPNLRYEGRHISDYIWKLLLVAVVWERRSLQYVK